MENKSILDKPRNTGTVTSVTGTAPIVSSGGAAPAISIPAATNTVPGYMTTAEVTALESASAVQHAQGTDTTLGTMTANIALNGYQITNQVIHTVADGTALLALTAVAGKLVFQADTARLYIYG